MTLYQFPISLYLLIVCAAAVVCIRQCCMCHRNCDTYNIGEYNVIFRQFMCYLFDLTVLFEF